MQKSVENSFNIFFIFFIIYYQINLTIFLDSGIDPNIQDNKGWAVLHYAVKCPIDNTDVLKYLLKKENLQIDVISMSITLSLNVTNNSF